MARKLDHILFYNLKYLLSAILIVGIFFVAPAQKKKKRRQQQISQVIQTGRSYIGTPYKWGGTSYAGIDCSGLIQNSYQSIGIKLPRVAKEQSKTGKKKNWENLRPGDLVYFKFKEKGQKKWFHSGMITRIEKDRILFIHASSSRGVVESNLMSDYYRSNVKNFRRVIK